ncbi:hypothetical protein E2C01_000891 [Portunus trituberculatus]|uniref:Uncharacterized protein n=1 Tax=Portunus trituberculatus TaxID=210409 RepID=A0A5B7CG94_PORTR|nr:hypothetical protein [Portunus trituberculatus]
MVPARHYTPVRGALADNIIAGGGSDRRVGCVKEEEKEEEMRARGGQNGVEWNGLRSGGGLGWPRPLHIPKQKAIACLVRGESNPLLFA